LLNLSHQSTPTALKQTLQQLIAQGKTGQAIDQLLQRTEHSGDTELREEVLMQSARYRDYAKARRLGTSSAEDQQTALARINQALLHISNQLPEDGDGDRSGGRRVKPRQTKAWQWVVGAGVVIGILSGIAGITGFNLKSLFGMGAAESPLQLTVYVHGPAGRQDIVLENEGQLILDLRNDRRVRKIGENGRTNFGEISRSFLEQPIPLSVQAEGYEMAHPDSSYVYDGEPIYLEVRSSCRFCKLVGTVQGPEGRLLPGLTVMVKGTELADTTGQNGRFFIQVPAEREQEEYILSVVDDGRIRWENYVTPSPESLIEILLPR